MAEVEVQWHRSDDKSWRAPSDLASGFKLGMDVQEVPYSRTRKSLGEGVVLELRQIGGRDQVLVDYLQKGQRVWVPYENLRAIDGVRQKFILERTGNADQAERFRLKSLAYALDLWNQNTGSLSRLEIDPLPHQIHLVHHILASGNLNWLIADDVGLGKTIEVGMLLAALQQRGQFRRILLVTPAGLVRQWQEELHHKFGMSDFQIYGTDFFVNDPRHWKIHDRVIGSIDRLKSEEHLEILLQAGAWDLIVFDEAHRLSRRQWSNRVDASQRFSLAATLRQKTDAMLLLTATPHQGMQDKFQAILELLRPELKEQIDSLSLHPQMLRDLVIRNRKADVTDSEGNFIFKAKTTRAVQVELGVEEERFQKLLTRYLTEGYAAGRRRGVQGRAIGFVMTTYRKLAASSIAAIDVALRRRVERLEKERVLDWNEEEEDERFGGEREELQLYAVSEKEFFDGELRMLGDLLRAAGHVLENDRKLAGFVRNLVEKVELQERGQKLLVFTEYRATQAYLVRNLEERYGQQAVVMINGGMTYAEREEAIRRFEDDAQFLVSTEAGGEGLNLHRACHVMVNYDLPWNPMRLVQRIGRLYRYGQKKNVVVFNMHAPQTIDAQIMQLMYTRITQVVSDMAPVGEEFSAGLEDEILGELAELLDVEGILEEASEQGIDRTTDRIDEALRRAREAVEKQRELFESAVGFDPRETRGELAIHRGHAEAFVAGMLPLLGIEVGEVTHGGRAIHIRLPESVQRELGVTRQRVAITFDREFATGRPDVQVMDFQAPLFRMLVDRAKAHEFGGGCSAIRGLEGRALFTAVLRWQNDQGMRMREELGVVVVGGDGQATVNPAWFAEWLLRVAAAASGGAAGDRELGKAVLAAAERAINERLGVPCSRVLHPENRQLIGAAWLFGRGP